MYNTERHCAKFNTDNPQDEEAYTRILNNPLCTIISERFEKIREEEFNEDTGRVARTTETMWRIVTWDEKVLMT